MTWPRLFAGVNRGHDSGARRLPLEIECILNVFAGPQTSTGKQFRGYNTAWALSERCPPLISNKWGQVLSSNDEDSSMLLAAFQARIILGLAALPLLPTQCCQKRRTQSNLPDRSIFCGAIAKGIRLSLYLTGPTAPATTLQVHRLQHECNIKHLRRVQRLVTRIGTAFSSLKKEKRLQWFLEHNCCLSNRHLHATSFQQLSSLGQTFISLHRICQMWNIKSFEDYVTTSMFDIKTINMVHLDKKTIALPWTAHAIELKVTAPKKVVLSAIVLEDVAPITMNGISLKWSILSHTWAI